ncbi:DUF952 domain-containing protein [Hoyosella rhizosphaerae]|uniref:DUF952 domain-containing protein n=1 Tax=Hoyosella rhizosphaerae TaxID=1755582 RepID=A0A916U4D5_9ACTN|nr:DUF952 domain-containing protein [Hoyosella rhizosphaerae]MBN4926574.1 DUF952 domain-containing protein [Hoyosella rhizosphaerae]GGC58188.1 hypothetical protein GCM10011410_08340 [Hoyosella rhizosphaerae]
MSIWHLVRRDDFESCNDALFRPPSLDAEGFIHCTGNLDTLVAVANRFYVHWVGDVVALEINPENVAAPIRWEAPSPAPPPGVDANISFPHIYGPLDTAAVVGVLQARRTPEGRYTGFE